jgi:RNA polymerase sigma factor (sigma-70 family)
VLYARQWCSYPDDALQEALIDLAHQTTDPRDPVAWLFQTVRCKALNQSRSEHRRAKYQNLAAQQREAWFVADPMCKLESSEVQAALDTLPALDREIVIARIWGGVSFEQISELVDRSSSFVYRRYRDALSELDKKMDGQVNNRCNES